LRSVSALEERFFAIWSARQEIPLVREYQGIPNRKFRFDFCHLETKVAIEIMGGVWTGGRHSGGSGQIKDFEKLNLAILGGWVVFQLSGEMLTPFWIDAIASAICRRQRSPNT
jgi:hypothetical protein